MTPETPRQGTPHEDDQLVSRIEIEFALPAYLPQGFMQDLVAAGEPQWDDSVYHIETSARPNWPGEGR